MVKDITALHFGAQKWKCVFWRQQSERQEEGRRNMDKVFFFQEGEKSQGKNGFDR